MEFNLDIIRAFANQSQSSEMINQANAIIAENIRNPDLALFILNAYTSPEVQNDQFLAHVIAIIFFKIVQYVWSLFPMKMDQYNSDVYLQLRNQIIPMCLNAPARSQPLMLEAFCVIVMNEDINSEDLVSNFCSLINPQQNLHTISIVFQIIEAYSYVVSAHQKDNVNRADPFCGKFLQTWSIILPQLQESLSAQPQASSFQILKYSALTMKNLINKAEGSLLIPDTMNMVQFFTNALILQNEDRECIKMKNAILLLIKETLAKVHDNSRKQFVEPMSQSFLASLLQTAPQIFSTILNNETIDALSTLMNIFYTLIYNNFSLEWFFSADFIYNFLIPAAHLTPNDLNEFETSPSQYIGSSILAIDSNRPESENDTYDSKYGSSSISQFLEPRIECAKIINFMIPRAPQLLNSDLSQFTDPLDLEAYLYLVYQGFLTRNESIGMDGQLYSQIFALLSTPNLPEFLYPTILCALQNNLILNNYEILKTAAATSYRILMNPQINLITAVCALALFRRTIITLAEHGELQSLVNLQELIPRLIQISSLVNTPEVQYVMHKLTEFCTAEMKEFSHILFGTFARSLEDICKLNDDINSQQETEIEGIIHTFLLLFDIQEGNMNEQLWFAEQIISFSVNILQLYPNSSSVTQLIELCVNIGKKTNLINSSDEMKIIFTKFSHFVLNYLSSSEDSLFLLPEFGSIFISMMPFLDAELLRAIQMLCVTIIQQTMEEFVSYAALIILSDIILIHGVNMNEIVQFAIDLIRGDEYVSSIFIGCIFVFTSALFKTNGEFAKFIPEDIIQKWFSTSSISFLGNEREIHTYALGLLILASNGHSNAFKAAGDLLFEDWQKIALDENEGMFLEEDEDEEMGELEQLILPIDKENVSKLFLQLVDKNGPPNEYPQPFLQWLYQRAYGDQ